MPDAIVGRKVMLISSDGHATARMDDYTDYMDPGLLDEFREFCPKRRFSSATSASSTTTRPRNSSISPACSTTNPASCSNDRPPDDIQHCSPPSQRSLPHLNSHPKRGFSRLCGSRGPAEEVTRMVKVRAGVVLDRLAV